MNKINCSHLRILNPENDEANYYRLHDGKKSSMRVKSRQSVGSLNASEIQFQNGQIKTESEQLELSKILSAPFEGSESRKEYFSVLNEELNSNVNQISTLYDTEIVNMRIQYQNRLRKLKGPEKSKKSTECGSPVSPEI